MRALTLDTGRAMGWARWRPGLVRPAFGLKEFPEPIGMRMAIFEDWVEEQIVANKLDLIAPEALTLGQHNNTDSVRWMAGANAALHKICYRHGIEIWEVAVASWRSTFIGVTRGPKAMKRQADRSAYLKNLALEECARRGWATGNHNVAEALGILDHCRLQRDPSYGATASILRRPR